MHYFNDEDLDGPAGGASPSAGYRTCEKCGTDCSPDPIGAHGLGIRIAFVCPEHGVQSVIDPFEDQQQ